MFCEDAVKESVEKRKIGSSDDEIRITLVQEDIKCNYCDDCTKKTKDKIPRIRKSDIPESINEIIDLIDIIFPKSPEIISQTPGKCDILMKFL